MIVVDASLEPTFRGSGSKRKRRSKATAYLDAAWEAWRAKYPCECEGETGYVCGQHQTEPPLFEPGHPQAGDINYDAPRELDPHMVAYRRKVIDRLARWLRWRDSVRPAIARPLVVGDTVAFVRARLRGRPRAGVVTEVGTVVEVGAGAATGHRSVSVVTAWFRGDGSDQRLDGTTRWLLPESWCTRIVARAAKGGGA